MQQLSCVLILIKLNCTVRRAWIDLHMIYKPCYVIQARFLDSLELVNWIWIWFSPWRGGWRATHVEQLDSGALSTLHLHCCQCCRTVGRTSKDNLNGTFFFCGNTLFFLGCIQFKKHFKGTRLNAGSTCELILNVCQYNYFALNLPLCSVHSLWCPIHVHYKSRIFWSSVHLPPRWVTLCYVVAHFEFLNSCGLPVF